MQGCTFWPQLLQMRTVPVGAHHLGRRLTRGTPGVLQFLAQHVRMADVRLYIRDALAKYASLQRFMPHPSWNAECYTGEMLLEQFGFPHAFDAEAVAKGGLLLQCSQAFPLPYLSL